MKFFDGIQYSGSETFRVGHRNALGPSDRHGFEILGSHHRTNTRSPGSPAVIIHNACKFNQIFTRRSDTGHFGFHIRFG